MEKKNYKKKIALIGYSGFIGSNLKKQFQTKSNYNSKNISKIIGEDFDILICAGTSSKRWQANKFPKADLKSIIKLINYLKKVKSTKFILISTIEVYGNNSNKSESSKINKKNNTDYGLNRLYLEEFIKKSFDSLIIRLPIVYGKNLKKNFIFDLINKKNLDQLNHNDIVQIYNVDNLIKDINYCLRKKIKEFNVWSEPIKLGDIAKKNFNVKISNKMKPRIMKMKSNFKKKYHYSKNYLEKELNQFIKKNK